MVNTRVIRFLYTRIAKPIFFRVDPEAVHEKMLRLGRILGSFFVTRAFTRWLFSYQHPSLQQTIAGIHFANPVGLSAGFDKDADLLKILPEVGFGFMQAGTVTFEPYEGNPKPRAVRLPRTRGLVVNYGLKSEGAENVARKIQKTKTRIPVSVSIGKTNCPRTADDEEGVKDYVNGLRVFLNAGVGDFYTLNVSCPNTFGGEPFTEPGKLDRLLQEVFRLHVTKPIFLKMPINLPWKEFRALLDVILTYKVAGVIIGNLNKDRSNPCIKDPIAERQKGSVSGIPCRELSNALISQTYQHAGDRLVIIGVGGIFSAEDAYEKLKRGASLVQLVTGMIFEGPQLMGEINRGLVDLLHRDGYAKIEEAIGTYEQNA